MKEEDNSIGNLNQLVKSLEEAGTKLEESYKSKDAQKFNQLKKWVLYLNQKISEVLK